MEGGSGGKALPVRNSTFYVDLLAASSLDDNNAAGGSGLAHATPQQQLARSHDTNGSGAFIHGDDLLQQQGRF